MKCFVFFELRSRVTLEFVCQWMSTTCMMIGDNFTDVVG
jgi:hypothetical protein